MGALFAGMIDVRRGGVTHAEKEEFRLRYGASNARIKPYLYRSQYDWVAANGGAFLIKQLIILAMQHENATGGLANYRNFTDVKHPLDSDEMFRPEFKVPASWKAWVDDRANFSTPVLVPTEAATSRFFRWLITEGRGY